MKRLPIYIMEVTDDRLCSWLLRSLQHGACHAHTRLTTTASSFDAMVEGLEVTIKYRGEKYNQVASPATPSSAFAILKKDLAHLRVHSPSQRNVQCANGSFILHWPTAGTSPKVAVLAVRASR